MENNAGPGQSLMERLAWQPKVAWDYLKEGENEEVFKLSQDYRDFLDRSKTEREGTKEIVARLRERGYKCLEELPPGTLPPGTRFFVANRGKSLIAGVSGTRPLREGFNLIGSHLDAPRLDLKPRPLYEADGLALFKTHYYGGIKKYQWTTIPLALHGVVVTGSGQLVEVSLGEKPEDPVLTITDLLPHLAKDQVKKTLEEGIAGEDLNLVVGSVPYAQDKKMKDRIKLAVLENLNGTYGIVEEDLASAELEVVPAGQARDVGVDRGLVGAYGQDDRVCAFASLQALLTVSQPEKMALGLFADKEEIGSIGNTGMQSRFLERVLAELLEREGKGSSADLVRTMALGEALSADVDGAIDPTFEGVMDKRNSALIGSGVVLTKYTGARGKSMANDAHAEFFGLVRNLFNKHGVIWQTGELGKVDQGGGGTIAGYLANLGMNVVDCGTAVLSMHAPMELTSKVDVYMTFKAYAAFFTN